MQTVVIENCRPALIVGVVKLKDLEEKVNLIPGENDVDLDAWNAYKVKPDVQQKIKAGWLRERTDIKRATAQYKKLETLEEGKAIAIVEKCTDAALMRTWAKRDMRSKVQHALIRRLEMLMVPQMPDESAKAAEPPAQAAQTAGPPSGKR